MNRGSVSCLLLMASVAFSTPVLADPPAKEVKLTPEEIEKKLLLRCWYEFESIEAGDNPPVNGSGVLGWKFGLKETVNWQVYGELVTNTCKGIKIDTTKTPWHLDLYSQERSKDPVFVLPTIFKFEGEDLIWVAQFRCNGWQPANPKNEYKGYPTEFTSTKENRYLYRRLKPCDYLQTTFPASHRRMK